MSLETIIRSQLNKREQRGRSPEFQAAITQEKAEFFQTLDNLGQNTYETLVTTLLKMPTDLFLNAFKTIYLKNHKDKKKQYNWNKYGKDAFNLFFGKDGIAHKTLKVTANAVVLTGQGTKIGIRQLFKL